MPSGHTCPAPLSARPQLLASADMSLKSLTHRKRLLSQAFFLAVFCMAVAAMALILALHLGRPVEGRPASQQTVPHASLDREFTPSSVDEGQNFAVKVNLDPHLGDPDADETNAICYGADNATETPCIEGGIIVWDSYNNDGGDRGFADELIAFKFRPGQQEKILTVFACKRREFRHPRH